MGSGGVMYVQQRADVTRAGSHRDLGWPLVSRDREESQLVDAVVAGRGAVITGPPGAGKTALATRSLETAEAYGMAMVRTTATRTSRAVPFGALALCLPQGTHARRLAEAGPGQQLRGFASAIVSRSAGRRLVFFADDAHLLDMGSATILHQLALARKVTVVAAVRSDGSVPDAVVALWKDGLADRIEVGPLDEAGVEALLLSTLGGPMDAASARRFFRDSQGNPMVLRELVTGALETDALIDVGGLWSLQRPPEPTARLDELIGLQLGDLSEPERKVLELLTVAEPLNEKVLDILADATAVEALDNKGLIASSLDGRRVQLRLAHPAYGLVVGTRMTALRRHALTNLLADTLQATGADGEKDLPRLASWRLTAGHGSAGLFVAGAMAAREDHDHSMTEQLARAAVQEGSGFQARFLAAEAAHLQGRHLQAARELAALSREASTDQQRAQVALARFHNERYCCGRTDLKLIDDALAVIKDSSCRDDLLAWRYSAVSMSSGPRGAVDASPALQRDFRPAPSRPAQGTLAYSLARLGRIASALELSRRPVTGTALTAPKEWALEPSFARISALLLAGRLDEAEELIAAVGKRPPGQPKGAGNCIAVGFAMLRLEQGRPVSALAHASPSCVLARQGRVTATTDLAFAACAEALALTGWGSRAADALAEYDSLDLPVVPAHDTEVCRARAWTAAANGNVPGARSQLQAAADAGEVVGDLAGAASALHDLARLGGAKAAAPRISALASHVEGDLVRARASYADAVAHRDHELLELVAGDFENMGALLYAAEARAEAAVILRRAGQCKRATAVERVAAKYVARCEGAATLPIRCLRARARLTPGELDVAFQAAAGLTNKRIADDLHLSVRTVESHLLRAYEKLGISRRSELASALA